MKNGKSGYQRKHKMVDLLGKPMNQGIGEVIWAGLGQKKPSTPRMETLGQATGYIAQYFNNIFTMIMGCSGSMQAVLPEHDPLRPYVRQILASSERAALLTRGLLAFTKKQAMNPRQIGLNQIVSSIRELVQRIVGNTIDLEIELSPVNPVVWGDEVQVGQVLMNLAANARDAMPDGGKLTIRTDVLKFREDDMHGGKWRCAALSVSDNGVGMDEETKKRAFEPFYTTKDAGKGIGLGLSIVKGIIGQHNGSINVTSKIGRGATFTLYLPMMVRPSISILPEAPAEHLREHRQGR